MERCPKCGEFMYSISTHECYPFVITHGAANETMYCQSFEEAVEKYAQGWNEWDSPVVNGDVFPSPITVTDSSGVSKRFNCYTEAVLEYYAKEEE